MAFDPSSATLAFDPSSATAVEEEPKRKFDPSTAAPLEAVEAPVATSAAQTGQSSGQLPPMLSGEGTMAYMRRTGQRPPAEEGDEPLVSADVLKAGYLASPFHWAAKAFPESSYGKAEQGLEKGISETVSGFTTPSNAAMLALAPAIPSGVAGKLIGTTIGAAFEAQAVKAFPEQWKQFKETIDPEEKWRLGTQMAAGLGLPLSVLTHTMRAGAEPPVDTAPVQQPEGSTPSPAEMLHVEPEKPPQLVPQPSEPVGAPVEDVGTSGVANRVYAAKAAQGLTSEIPSGEGMSAEDVVNLGRKKIAEGVDPNEVAQRFAQDKRLSAEDFGVLRAKGEELDQAVKAAEREVVQDPDNPIKRQFADQAAQEADGWHRNIVQPAKTATSDIFRGMQGETDIDTGSFYTMKRAFEDVNKRPAAPREQFRIAERVADVQKASDLEAYHSKRLSNAIDREFPRKTKETVEQLESRLAQQIADDTRKLTPCEL